jgi:hypothetical protein
MYFLDCKIDLRIKENELDKQWESQYASLLAEAINVKWKIEHRGVDGVVLSISNYKESDSGLRIT